MAQKNIKQHSFGELVEASLPDDAALTIENSLGEDAYQALLSDAFKNGVVQEPIYGKDQYIAHESLSRPAHDEVQFHMDILSQQFYAHGVAEEFDILTSANGLKGAENLPVTLNIAVDTVLSSGFWNKMEKRLSPFSPDDLVFEILEHDVDLNSDISHMYALRDQGYRFALDDFALGESHKNRLKVFGDVIDYIKIDGPIIRAFFDGDSDTNKHDDLANILEYIRETHPDIELIAERVRSRQEADQLFDMGFTGVQGRQLRAEDFDYATKVDSTCQKTLDL